MANMSYCRFQNTLQDLIDCAENMDGGDLSFEEERARYFLIKRCWEIAENYGYELESPPPKRPKNDTAA